ncbi:3-isopropylmalate dehydratase small subunit (plasmid) [Buchnera aphidicola (Cinara piceae)]|uniref:3-isopropylmalate dehydratase small subunit n=1 Tax=Buchnera aphidicola (Cinara piceae) TaxID=1660043 RepID=A0A803GD08_9GAMM|nr:3-isopropylmalate dehydratase small subunit [Buchnera aphidicola]VFP88978.1 3-isopropylmalate dehydratase small subunit [Buchnera aphidicola (Cinara piceae)]
MKNFIKHIGSIAPLDISNIDTDIIIPKQFLQKINKKGFGKHLFHNWRFLDHLGEIENPNFILNKKIYRNSSILLTRSNFGCGSSREHAVWSLLDYGFKVIIGQSFSDIFVNNCLNNRLLLISFSKKIIDKLFFIIKKKKNIICMINLLKEKIFIDNNSISFSINPIHKQSIMYNFDNIDYTLTHEKKIDLYEKNKYQYCFISNNY